MGYRLTFYKIKKKKLDDVGEQTDAKYKYNDDDRSGFKELR